MSTTENEPPKRFDRRGFLKSIIGLGADGLPTFESKLQQQFVWTDLRTGQMGFPFGLAKTDILPGALMHPIAAAALLDESLLKTEITYKCSAKEIADHESFSCSSAHGQVDLNLALALNCRSFFVNAARLISTPLFLRFGESFGLNQAVGTFSAGVFPKSRTGSSISYVTGLNRELRPTLLQILRMTALIAKNGRLQKKMHSAEQTVEGEEPVRIRLQSGTWTALHEGMRTSCISGAAIHLDPKDKLRICAIAATVAGKSGFTQCVSGYFPYEEPIYAFTICCPSEAADQTGINFSRELLLAQEWP